MIEHILKAIAEDAILESGWSEHWSDAFQYTALTIDLGYNGMHILCWYNKDDGLFMRFWAAEGVKFLYPLTDLQDLLHRVKVKLTAKSSP